MSCNICGRGSLSETIAEATTYFKSEQGKIKLALIENLHPYWLVFKALKITMYDIRVEKQS